MFYIENIKQNGIYQYVPVKRKSIVFPRQALEIPVFTNTMNPSTSILWPTLWGMTKMWLLYNFTNYYQSVIMLNTQIFFVISFYT